MRKVYLDSDYKNTKKNRYSDIRNKKNAREGIMLTRKFTPRGASSKNQCSKIQPSRT